MSEPIKWTNVTLKLSQLKKWENNPAEISKEAAGRLVECFNEFGQIETLAVDPENRLVDGHQRLDTWLAKYGDIEVDCRKASRMLTEKERQKIAVMLRSGAVGRYNWDVVSGWDSKEVIDWIGEDTIKDWKRDITAVGMMLEADEKKEKNIKQDDDLPPLLDYIFPIDNDYGIPCLNIDKQPVALEAPIKRIGQDSRHKESSKLIGTLHFYTDDYKFNSVWGDPFQTVINNASCIIEPNYSTNDTMPLAVAVYGIFKKRWLSRLWQEFDKKIIVDLNVDPKFDEINLIGVPKGWRSYSTRYYQRYGLDDLKRQFDMACNHSQRKDILFVVFGGSKEAEQACKDNGWNFIQSEFKEVQNG